jgi:hypothetical protein
MKSDFMCHEFSLQAQCKSHSSDSKQLTPHPQILGNSIGGLSQERGAHSHCQCIGTTSLIYTVLSILVDY